jgi:hypothetical protein
LTLRDRLILEQGFLAFFLTLVHLQIVAASEEREVETPTIRVDSTRVAERITDFEFIIGIFVKI